MSYFSEFEIEVGIIVRTAVMLVGLACIYYAMRLIKRRRAVRRDPVASSGKVISLERVPSEDGPDWYTPTVRYKDDAGTVFRSKLSITKDTKAFAVGREVSIVYERGNPQNVVDPSDGWAEPIALGLILTVGVLIVLFGALVEVVPAQ